MFARVSYDDAALVDPDPEAIRGVSTDEMVQMLRDLGLSAQVTKAQYRKPIALAVLPERGLLVVREDGRDYGHWVGVYKGRIYDPELPGRISVCEYPRSHWRVIRIVTG